MPRGYWVYGGGGDAGGSYFVEDDSYDEVGLTQDEVTQSFRSILGRDPSEYDLQSWVGSSYDMPKDRQLYNLQRDITLLPEYRQKNQPFYDPGSGNGSFEAGVNYYKDQGYIPSGDYEGVPTAFYDKDGNLKAWYGDIGTTWGKSGKYAPNRTETYGWHMADELGKIPNAIPVTAHENPDKNGWLGGGQWIAPVAMMGTLLGAAALAPAAAGAASAGAAGSGGSLTAGITPSMVAGWEAALPTAFGEVGAGSLTAGITPSMVAGWEAALPSAFGEVGAGSLTAGITPEMVAGWESALPSSLSEMGLSGSTGSSLMSTLQNLNRARSAISTISKLTGGGSQQSGGGLGGSGYGGVSGTSPLNVVAVNAPQVAQAYPVAPLSPYMTSFESPSEVAARGIKMEGIEDQNPKLKEVTPELKKLLIDKLGTNQNQFIADPLGALDRGELSPGFRRGGHVMNEDGEPHIPEFITGKTGHYVDGRGTGQSDEIPAMLADGEYVIDADTVAALGDGSSKAGSELLDKFREAIREHKRSAPADKIPPKASPLQYMKVAMKAAGR